MRNALYVCVSMLVGCCSNKLETTQHKLCTWVPRSCVCVPVDVYAGAYVKRRKARALKVIHLRYGGQRAVGNVELRVLRLDAGELRVEQRGGGGERGARAFGVETAQRGLVHGA